MKTTMLAFAGAALIATPAIAAPVEFDFEDLDFGPIPGETLERSGGGLTAIFAGMGLRIRALGGGFDALYGEKYLSTTFDSETITVTFDDAATVGSVSIINPINGTVTGEIDTITMSIFDADDNLIDSVVSSAETISLVGAGIARVTFDGASTGYVIASILFDGDFGEVPEPAALALFGLGIAAIGMGRRRRR